MNQNSAIAFFVFLAFIIASRLIMNSAIKKLSDEERAKLLSNNDLDKGSRRLIITVIVLGLFYFLLYQFPIYANYLLWIFLAVFIISRVYAFYAAKKRIVLLELPAWYIKTFTLATIVINIGFVVFFAIILRNYFKSIF